MSLDCRDTPGRLLALDSDFHVFLWSGTGFHLFPHAFLARIMFARMTCKLKEAEMKQVRVVLRGVRFHGKETVVIVSQALFGFVCLRLQSTRPYIYVPMTFGLVLASMYPLGSDKYCVGHVKEVESRIANSCRITEQ